MNLLRTLRFRLRALFRGARLDREMDDEMRLHLEMEAREIVADGAPLDEARRQAALAFGGCERIREEIRDARGVRWLEDAIADVRFAIRGLCKDPTFTFAVVAMLAIGIGATTAMVNIGRQDVFPTIPFPDPERLVIINNTDASIAPQPKDEFPFFSFPSLFASLREGSTSFAMLGGVRKDSLNLIVDGDPMVADVRWVTADFFAVLGARAQFGRLFMPEEFGESATSVVLSEKAWKERFGSSRDIVGRSIRVGEESYEVVGVLPGNFALPLGFVTPGDLYLPEAPSPMAPLFPHRWMQVVGRLRSDVSLEEATAETLLIHQRNPARLNAEWLARNKPRLVRLIEYNDRGGSNRFWVFFGAVGLLYVIACSNAASLMLARVVSRQREFGVRLALGGSRRRIIRLVLAENAVLSLAGGLGGIVIARWGCSMWSAFFQTAVPLDAGTLAAAALASVLTCGVMALVPLGRIRDARLQPMLREGAGSLGDSRRIGTLRAGLIVGQAALAVVLLVGTGLMARSFLRLQRVDFGFNPSGKVAVFGMLPEGMGPEVYLHLAEQLRQRLAALPGVRNVTVSGTVPLTQALMSWSGIKINGEPDREELQFTINRVSPEYFATMGVPIRSGRGFDGLKPGDPAVALINETAARRYFGNVDPIGRCLNHGQTGMWEIIGVVGDVRDGADRRAAIAPQLYFPFWQPPLTVGFLSEVLQLQAAPVAGLDALIRRTAYEADPRLVVRVHRLSDNAAETLRIERNTTVLMQMLTFIAIALTTLGLFSVMTYAVAQRRREFGLRMALGAAPRDLLRLVFRRGLRLAMIGIALGLGIAAGLTRFMQRLLFETSAHDPLIHGAAAVGLLVAATLACWLPARRAATVDPMIALRAE